MQDLVTADSVDVLVLVDNASDFLSSAPPSVEGELSRFWRRGARLLAGRFTCCAAHGLSLAITARAGGVSRTLLFDAGPDGAILAGNVARLGFDMGDVDGLFLSHGHWDHAGGMLTALDLVREARPAGPLPTFMHPGMYRSRAMRDADGTMRPFEDVPPASLLEEHGAEVFHASEPAVVIILSAVSILSFIKTGIPCRGPLVLPAFLSSSICLAIAAASGLISITEFSEGPALSISFMRCR